MVADAPPNSKADTRHGKTRNDANSGGKEDEDSVNVLANDEQLLHQA